jgi:hypothetical protein
MSRDTITRTIRLATHTTVNDKRSCIVTGLPSGRDEASAGAPGMSQTVGGADTWSARRIVCTRPVTTS